MSAEISQQEALAPIERDSLYLKVADALYEYIRTNQLKAGDRLPSERVMAQTLHISRNSLREGIRVLEAKGILQVKTGSGIYMKDTNAGDSELVAKIGGVSLTELQELQTTLDHQAVRNAIHRGTIEEKQQLVSLGEELVALSRQKLYSHTLDYSFHNLLYAMGRNRAISQLIGQIRNDRFVYREEIQHGDNESVWLQTVPQHLSLARDILAGDERAALADMDEILLYGFDLIEKN
ncbi:MAG: FadR/GntR family transcriptional regulator [Bilifractor sp.]